LPQAFPRLEFSGGRPIIRLMRTASTLRVTGTIRRIIVPAS